MSEVMSLADFKRDLATLPNGQGRKALESVELINTWKHDRTVHHLKTWPQFFVDVLGGHKPFELRKNDRNFQVGDLVCLWEYYDGIYSDRAILAAVPYVLKDALGFGLQDGFCILTLRVLCNRT